MKRSSIKEGKKACESSLAAIKKKLADSMRARELKNKIAQVSARLINKRKELKEARVALKEKEEDSELFKRKIVERESNLRSYC